MGLGVALGKRSSSGDGCGVEEARRDGGLVALALLRAYMVAAAS